MMTFWRTHEPIPSIFILITSSLITVHILLVLYEYLLVYLYSLLILYRYIMLLRKNEYERDICTE
jgi:hypothetical protein